LALEDKAAQAAAQAAQAAALQSAYTAPPIVGSLTKEQAFQILQRLGLSYPTPSGYMDVENASLSNNSYMTNGYGSHADAVRLKDEMNTAFFTRPDLIRNQSNFSPFSPDPNNLYTSSDSLGRELNPFGSRLDSFSHSSLAPGFFVQPQELKVNTAVNVDELKVSPSPARPTSGNRYSFAEHTNPLATVNGSYGRTEPAISRPATGQLECSRDTGPIHDLNGTLASLDLELDRPWRSPGIRAKSSC